MLYCWFFYKCYIVGFIKKKKIRNFVIFVILLLSLKNINIIFEFVTFESHKYLYL